MNYLMHLMFVLAIYVMLAASLDILIGHLGLLVLCQSAFFAVGAYAYAISVVKLDLPVLLALFISLIVSMLYALPLSIAARKLRGDAIVLGSFAYLLITIDLLENIRPLTGGLEGIAGISNIVFLSDYQLNHKIQIIVVILATVLCLILLRRLLESVQGSFFHALRDNPFASIGLRTYSSNLFLQGFLIASGIAGLAGAFFASYMTYINPSIFDADNSIKIIAMVLIGGASKSYGPILGAVLILSVSELARNFGAGTSDIGSINYIVMGVFLLFFSLFRPKGILGGYEFK